MISSLLHLVGLRPRVCYTLTNFRGMGGGGQGPLAPPPQYANQIPLFIIKHIYYSYTPGYTLAVCYFAPWEILKKHVLV